MKSFIRLFLIGSLAFGTITLSAQSTDKTDNKKEEGFVFTELYSVPTTTVKNQGSSGTCWSYAATSFVETEVLRQNGDTLDLSDIFFVRQAYAAKAKKYVRLHGAGNYSQGGQAHDVTNVIKTDGFVTESDFTGNTIGEDVNMHGEVSEVTTDFVEGVIKNKNRKLTPVWFDAYQGILDAYLGEVPQTIVYEEVEMTPQEFTGLMNFDPNDYVELTSYSNYTFYDKVALEIPDNWSWDLYYNLPLNEMMEVINYALENGYSVCWDGDVSDKGFSHRNGVAIIPDAEKKSLEGSEQARWEKLSASDKRKELYSFDKPMPEKCITQENRQEQFDNYQSTDDHLMHLTGIVKDQNDTPYYVTKNSWSETSNKFGGYLNMSESYVRLNTVAIMVHKDAIPKQIRKKLGL